MLVTVRGVGLERERERERVRSKCNTRHLDMVSEADLLLRSHFIRTFSNRVQTNIAVLGALRKYR
jgi:hypothetical protein